MISKYQEKDNKFCVTINFTFQMLKKCLVQGKFILQFKKKNIYSKEFKNFIKINGHNNVS